VTDRKRETMVSVWLLFDFDLILILSRFYAPTKDYITPSFFNQLKPILVKLPQLHYLLHTEHYR